VRQFKDQSQSIAAANALYRRVKSEFCCVVSDKSLSRLMAGKARERHAHFADDVYLEREGSSEKAHEEDELEFKKKQRRRSSVAHLPLGFASLRRISSASGDCESLLSHQSSLFYCVV